MAEESTVTSPDVTNIDIADICGLWEVIRISRKDDNKVSYPWLEGRFMFNFLEENIFLCIKNKQCNHGTWKLQRKAFKTNNRFSIILNGTLGYTILGIDEDEIILSDRNCKYFLTRKL